MPHLAYALRGTVKGDRQGTWAVKVSGNWRITFVFRGEDAESVDYEDYH
jgi:proteic killer suppression protein